MPDAQSIQAGPRGTHGDVVVEAQRQAEGVEARTEVRAGGRHLHRHGTLAYLHGQGQARPSCAAAAPASTGTVTGFGAPAIAHSGSFKPLPVTVQTTCSPALNQSFSRAN